MTEELNNKEESNAGQPIIVNQIEKNSNGIGVAGFILALIGLFFGWIPVIGWIIWILGLILSFIGVFKSPRGMAIAGLIISLIGFIITFLILGSIGIALGL